MQPHKTKQGALPHVDPRKRKIRSLELDCDLLLHRIGGCQPGDLDRSMTLAAGAGSGGAARAELTVCPWIRLENCRKNQREKVGNCRAKACRELPRRPGSARWPAGAGWWSPES